MQRTEDHPRRHAARGTRLTARAAVLTLILAIVAAAGCYLGYQQYRVSRWAGVVGRAFRAHRYEAAREPLRRWLRERPQSAEAAYYRVWLALVDQDPDEAVKGFEQARRSGLDPALIRPLTAVYQARAHRIRETEPSLREAFAQKREPQIEVAKELARIYLTSYRLPEAGVVIERWRSLAPEDPLPYLWSNEVAARSNAEPSVLIQNYRAALERDPNLDQAHLGLAEQLSKDRRFDEAEREFQTHLKRNPNDANALVGLGRNAFQAGDLEAASRHFEAALLVDPRQPEALKELALADLRRGEVKKACQRYERLIQVVPYEFDIRYAYAQALGCGPGVRTRAANTRMAHSGWVAGVGTRRVTPPGPPPRGPIPWGLCRPRRLRPQPPEGQAGPNEVLDDFWAGVA